MKHHTDSPTSTAENTAQGIHRARVVSWEMGGGGKEKMWDKCWSFLMSCFKKSNQIMFYTEGRELQTHIDPCSIKWTSDTNRWPSIDGHLCVTATDHQTLPIVGNCDTNGKEKSDTTCCWEQSIQDWCSQEAYLLKIDSTKKLHIWGDVQSVSDWSDHIGRWSQIKFLPLWAH